MKNIIIFLILIAGVLLNGVSCFAQSGDVYTVAGGGTLTTDGVPATSATLSTTCGMGLDGLGNVYFVDDGVSKIKKIDHSTGLIYTVAGNGTSGYSGDGGPATDAEFGDVRSIWVDAPGNIYIADHGNNLLRKVDATTGIMTTIAGGGSSLADGIPATSADIGEQLCVVMDYAGNIYCSGNNSVRKINPSTGIITTVAGGGTSSADGVPASSAAISSGVKSISLDASGNIYIISHDGTPLRKVDAVTGLINTIAGAGSSTADSIPAAAFRMSDNHCARVDSAGNVFVSDWSGGKIRRIDAVTGIMKTIAGGGSSTANGTPALSAYVHPYQIYLDATGGNIYWADYSSLVRRFSFSPIYGGGTTTSTSTDSFYVSVMALCNGPQLTVITPNYVAGRSVKIYYGDGTTDSNTIMPGYLTGGYTILNHTYPSAATYTIRGILYNGVTIVDSVSFYFAYTLCRALPIDLFYDANGNCIKDSSESYASLPSVAEVKKNGIPVDTISATSGFSYSAYNCAPGDIYTFKVISTPGNLTVTCPSTGFINDTIRSATSDYPAKYFALACSTGSSFDLSVSAVVPVTGVHDQWGNIYIQNTYCEPIDATVTLTFSPKYAADNSGWYDISPLPTIISGNTLTWNVTGIAAFASRPVDLYYAIWDNPVTGFLTVGDSVQSHYTVTPITGDVLPANNVEIIIDTVKAGCDPNEMSVSPIGCIPTGTAEQLQYTVSFVNTGNDTAFNISVMDTLPANVDVQSMQIVLSSAQMFVTRLYDPLYGNILKFDFPGINLLDSSQNSQKCSGAVIFAINTLPGLVSGTTISNRAGVYFDINPVVMTNTVENIVGCGELNVATISNKTNIQIFPNPASTQLNIVSQSSINQITITNLIGQNVYNHAYNAATVQIDVSDLPTGVYFVKVNGSEVRKFVKE